MRWFVWAIRAGLWGQKDGWPGVHFRDGFSLIPKYTFSILIVMRVLPFLVVGLISVGKMPAQTPRPVPPLTQTSFSCNYTGQSSPVVTHRCFSILHSLRS